ncbi:MAG: CPBP family intramembrane metalloprotease [Clostridiaceae bacterium]|nr:CPBP family intramembrane metalloprotease [Clostridiaceae bacterium]
MGKIRTFVSALCYIGIYIIIRTVSTLILILSILFSQIAQGTEITKSIDYINKNSNYSQIANLIAICVTLFVFIRAIDKKKGIRLFQYCKFNKLPLPHSILCAVTGITLNVLMTALVSFLFIVKSPAAINTVKNINSGNSDTLLVLVSVCIMTPVLEEILFRGIVQQEFTNNELFFAVLFQALLFGLYHLNPIQIIYTFILGIILGLTFYTFKSLIAPIIMHISFNCTNLIINKAADFLSINNFQHKLIIVSVFASIICLGSIFLNLRKAQKESVRQAINISAD